MRKLETVIVLLVIFTLFSAMSFADDWQIDFVDTYGYVGHFTSIALDSGDNPHISYYDSYPNRDLKYAFWDGSAWVVSAIDTYGDVGYHSSIALDSGDKPHISYWGHTNGDLKYAFWNGSYWDISVVDTAGFVGNYTSIALDSDDNPHISYYDSYPNRDLKYAFWDGSAWDISAVDTVGNVGQYTSIALDSYDNPHISYHDAYPNIDLKYAFWDGSSWYITAVDTPGSVGEYNSIALDSGDNPHISYWDFTNKDLKYSFWDGYTWEITAIDNAGSVCIYTSIALDSDDNPHISYYDSYSNHDLKYAYWNGSDWSIVVIDAEGDVGYYTSIALDSGDNPHISYYTVTGGDLKYAWYGPMPGISLDHFSAQAEGSAIAINWTVQTTEGEQVLGFNLYRREINNNIAAEVSNLGCIWTKVNTSLITGQNPYTYTDSDVEANVAYEYKLEAVLADDSPETLGTTQATAGQPTSFAILAIYPNPASDTLKCLLALPSAGAVELALYDLSGRLVLEQQLKATEPTELEAILDVSGLASGVYTLQASFGGAEVSPACGGVAVVVR